MVMCRMFSVWLGGEGWGVGGLWVRWVGWGGVVVCILFVVGFGLGVGFVDCFCGVCLLVLGCFMVLGVWLYWCYLFVLGFFW